MTTSAAQIFAREGQELGNLRTRSADADRAGRVERGELPGLFEAALERAADLALAGRLAESRAFIQKYLSK